MLGNSKKSIFIIAEYLKKIQKYRFNLILLIIKAYALYFALFTPIASASPWSLAIAFIALPNLEVSKVQIRQIKKLPYIYSWF